jgi:enamine deaminase RidA (YjgF/YER057c/UK114 family)
MIGSISGFAIKDYKYLSPIFKNSSTDQIESCIFQLQKLTHNSIILKITFFIYATNTLEFIQVKSTINKLLLSFSLQKIPVSIVCQAPQNNYLICAEAITTSLQLEPQIAYKSTPEFQYIVFETAHSKELFCGGISSNKLDATIHDQSMFAFEMLENILKTEGMLFSDILRQWNYIENILEFDSQATCSSQHYQTFNDVRTLFYSKNEFKNGYPAATGIGMNLGGIVIDFIAQKSNHIEIFPLKSPVQTDAHKYTSDVLKENYLIPNIQKSTPKFERAKVVIQNKSGIIFVSGTAAIKGQNTIYQTDVDNQTKLTIDSINQLISSENISQQLGINYNFEIKFSSVRVYVKNFSDMLVVSEICEQHYTQIPIIIVNSDICRDDLLVEIEAVCQINGY